MEPMSSANPAQAPVVKAGSHLTLHYRVSLADAGTDVINTFGERPATLQVGVGQMAEALERCLLGLAEGERRSFELAPQQAFGERSPELVQKLARDTFDANVDNADDYRPGDLVDIAGPDGGRIAGVLKELTERHALFDFNHPLAGHALRFEVHILGVL